MEQTFAMELAKLIMFSICVTATLEVVKALYEQMVGDAMQEARVKVVNFLLALLYCWVLGYGIMVRVFFAGEQPKGTLASWLDYIATASLLYMGADWIFNKFSASIAKAKAIKQKARTDNSSVKTKTKETSETVIQERTVV